MKTSLDTIPMRIYQTRLDFHNTQQLITKLQKKLFALKMREWALQGRLIKNNLILRDAHFQFTKSYKRDIL